MNNILRELKHKGYVWGACIFALLLPFNQFMSSCGIGLWILLSIISFNRADLSKNKSLLLFPLLYLLYFVSLLYSENDAYTILERKLSLVVFPLLFFLHKYDVSQRKLILKVFIYGLLVSGVVCLLVALYRSINIENETIVFKANVLEGKGFIESIMYGGNYFFGDHLSIFHQTVYYAIYLNLGIAILLFNNLRLNIKWRMVLILFFAGLIFIISNKANIIVLMGIFLVKLIFSNLNIKSKVFCFAVLSLGGLFILYNNPRISNSLVQFKENGFTINKDSRYDYKTRILSWDAALTLIKSKPLFGYGAGDAQTELNKVYKEREYIWPYKRDLNAHNQYMQLWIETGFLGLAVFLLILYVLFRYGLRKSRNVWILCAFIILFINAIFESVLNRYSGISMISFLCCFVFSEINKKEIEN